ncbi:MAG TPA: hypothetical protein V6C97_21100 [Oculatellaceae cyanobacterium]
MKTKLKKSKSAFMENAMVDSTRLRAALMMACTALADGDPMEGLALAEEFYDEAPKLLKIMTEGGIDNLPGGPALVVPFSPK